MDRLLLSCLACALSAPGSPAQLTARISVDSSGNEAHGPSSSPALSYDGRWAVFDSAAANLVAGDTNGARDIFVVEVATGAIERASVSDAGVEADAACYRPSLSHDGRFVVFHSAADSLAAADSNGLPDVFVRDRLLGTTRLVSVTPALVPGNGSSSYGAVAAGGQHVAFSSLATDLVPGDSNGTTDVFVRDLAAGTTERVSVGSGGAQGDGYSTFAAISADGRFVAFQSAATNLVAGDGNGLSDIFVRDRLLGTTVRASVPTPGGDADGASSLAAISADGRFVAFQSSATNLVAGDTNGTDDIFLRDLVDSTTVRVSTALGGGEGDAPGVGPALSGDGRAVAFVCHSEFLIPADANGTPDVVVHDHVSGNLENLSVDSLAVQSEGMSLAVALDASGTRAVFQSFGANLVPNDTNLVPDVFLRLRGPFHPASCAGDGSLPQPCPCGNTGAGGHGCANSLSAAGGVLEGSGNTGLDELTLVARDLIPQTLSIFVQGDSFDPAGIVFGDGLRCISGALLRLYVRQSEFGCAFAPGPYDLGLRARAQALGDPLPPGSLRGYQVYYRDPDPGFCPGPSGNTWNITNAVEVQW